MKLTIFMVSGKMHSGKGLVSELMEKEFKKTNNFNVIRCSLSEYIRRIVVDDFYYTGSQDTEDCREFMAKVYELGSNLYPHHKARRLWERDIVPYLREDIDNIIIIESFREVNDIKYFYTEELFEKWHDLYTIRVERNVENYDMKNNHLINHKSEVDLDNYNFNHCINNDGTIEELKDEVNSFISSIVCHFNKVKSMEENK